MHPKFLTNFVHSPDATDRLECHLGLELTAKILALRFAHYLRLLKQATILIHCLKIGVRFTFLFPARPGRGAPVASLPIVTLGGGHEPTV